MATCTEPRDSAVTGEGATKRLFDLLDPESQDRVVLFKTKYEQMMGLERSAFLQELGLVSTRDEEAEAARRALHGKLTIYKNERLAAVQGREPGFVILQQDASAAPDEPAFQDEEDREEELAERRATVGLPMSDLALRRLLNDDVFGEAKMVIKTERKSVYEKVAVLEGEEEEAEKAKKEAEKQEKEAMLRRKSNAMPKPATTIGVPGEYLYRSNAYQALRLAHSFPGRINIKPGGATSSSAENDKGSSGDAEDPALTNATVNVTGIPIYEDELRKWFDAMDTTGSGTLDCAEFMAFMRSLDRDFGVAEEYAQLERDGQKLALDGKLSFEAFAYLVMRFARA